MKFNGRTVVVQDGNIEKALRKFKKKINEDGLLLELQERRAYVKPTTARKLKKSLAKKRWKKQLKSQELPKKHF